MDAIVRIVDDEETVRNSELFIFKLAGIPAVAYSSAEEFLSRDDLSQAGSGSPNDGNERTGAPEMLTGKGKRSSDYLFNRSRNGGCRSDGP